jgi:hypothetical protein
MKCSRHYVRVHGIQISWCDEVISSFSRGQVRCDPLLLRDIAVRLSDHQVVLEIYNKFSKVWGQGFVILLAGFWYAIGCNGRPGAGE